MSTTDPTGFISGRPLHVVWNLAFPMHDEDDQAMARFYFDALRQDANVASIEMVEALTQPVMYAEVRFHPDRREPSSAELRGLIHTHATPRNAVTHFLREPPSGTAEATATLLDRMAQARRSTGRELQYYASRSYPTPDPPSWVATGTWCRRTEDGVLFRISGIVFTTTPVHVALEDAGMTIPLPVFLREYETSAPPRRGPTLFERLSGDDDL